MPPAPCSDRVDVGRALGPVADAEEIDLFVADGQRVRASLSISTPLAASAAGMS